MWRTAVLVPCFTLLACTSETPGARPHDMSAEAHERMAASAEASGTEHTARFDPQAGAEKSQCGSARGDTRICWTSVANPTAEHLKHAESFQKMAADHRTAAKALRDAEAATCGGLSDGDRDMSPFAHREDITAIGELTATMGTKPPTPSLRGASITLRAVPGLTKEYLERVLSCHLARNAAMGFAMPEMAFCPLGVKGASATVQSVEGGFRVDVAADDRGAIDEIAKRARALGPGK